MWYTNRQQLTVIEIDEKTENISIKQLMKILMKHPSNVVYCELQEKLLGIISTGDIYRAYTKKMDCVKINKKFSYIYSGEYMKARTIFKQKVNINALPIISKEGILIGDYTRWDDIILLETILNIRGYDTGSWNNVQKIALIRPDDIFMAKKRIYNRMIEYLLERNITVQSVSYSEVFQSAESIDVILAVDENELRAWKLLFATTCKNKDEVPNISSYKNVMLDNTDFSDVQREAYFRSLHNQGISIWGLTFNGSAYCKEIRKQIHNKYAAVGEVPCNKLSQSMYEDFFDDLYSEEYASEILSIPYALDNNGGVISLKDCKSKYYNVTNGERSTVGQPEDYEKSIYFFGACYIYGHWVEDKNTIESFLQKRLCDNGKAVRVVNCGSLGMGIDHRYLSRIMVTELKKGDIIVIGSLPKGIDGVEYLDLSETLEKNKVDAGWLIDWPGHCNHKVNKLYADAIYESLESHFSEKVKEQGKVLEKDDNFIKLLYLDRYFKDFDFSEYEKIGAIVMNCNPFTYGHRYLIEQALNIVDFLIIFVVEEDRSIFSFAERFTMVREGTVNLENIMVVPSGPFILSQISFPEYFIKETSKDIEEHTEQDITTFAVKIAPQIGIKYRFVGEELEDDVTNQYNLAMKRILPKYGIELIEIPRKTVNGKCISASSARGYIETDNKDKLVQLLPETTRKVIGNVIFKD